MQEEANRIKKENQVKITFKPFDAQLFEIFPKNGLLYMLTQETFKKEREALQKSQNVSTTSVADTKVTDTDSTNEETNSNSEVSESTPSQAAVRGRKAKLIGEVETVEVSPSRQLIVSSYEY